MALFILWTDTIKIVKKLFAINLIFSIRKHYCGLDHMQFWNVIIVSNSCIASKREWPAMYGSWTKEYGIEGRYNWRGHPTIWLYMLCRQYSIGIRNICLIYNYRVYNNLFWIFLLQMEYRLRSMYNHMVGQAASALSPLYSILLGLNWNCSSVEETLGFISDI